MSTKKDKKYRILDVLVSAEWVYYFLFLTILAMVYIYINHRVENTIRNINKVKNELIELRAENITLKSEIIKNSSVGAVEHRLQSTGIKSPNKPVYKIVIPNE
jgi:regulatory protein YycI of two-component signal transduction system YycFG